MSGALSDDRSCLYFTVLSGPQSSVFLSHRPRRTNHHILLSQFLDSPTWMAGFCIHFPRNKVAHLYPQPMDLCNYFTYLYTVYLYFLIYATHKSSISTGLVQQIIPYNSSSSYSGVITEIAYTSLEIYTYQNIKI